MTPQGAARAQSAGLRWSQDELWLALAGPALIFAGHALYGAMLPSTALLLALVGSLLLAACLIKPRLRKDLSRVQGLAAPAGLFAVVLLVALWSLTPFTPGGAHPVWAYLGISPAAATIDKSATGLEVVKLLGLGAVFVVGVATGASDGRAKLAVNVLLILGAALGAWSFLAFVAEGVTVGRRLEASFLSANTAATLFACLFVLTAGPATSVLRSAPRARRLTGVTPFGAAALLFIICLFATASRGAFAAAASGLAAFGLLQVFGGKLKWSRAALAGVIAIVILCGLLVVAGDFLLSRFFLVSHDVASRGFIAHVHWQAFLASPLMGYGLGTFDVMNRILLDAGNFDQIWTVRAAHNIYLAWLEQAGLLGAVPMFAGIGATIGLTVRNGFRRTRMSSLIFALVAADVVFLVHGATDFALEMYSMAALWAYLLGLQFSLAQGTSSR